MIDIALSNKMMHNLPKNVYRMIPDRAKEIIKQIEQESVRRNAILGDKAYPVIYKPEVVFELFVSSMEYPVKTPNDGKPVFNLFSHRRFTFSTPDSYGHFSSASLTFSIDNVAVTCSMTYLTSLQAVTFEAACIVLDQYPVVETFTQLNDVILLTHFRVAPNYKFMRLWFDKMSDRKLLDFADMLFGETLIEMVLKMDITEQKAFVMNELNRRGLTLDKGDWCL